MTELLSLVIIEAMNVQNIPWYISPILFSIGVALIVWGKHLLSKTDNRNTKLEFVFIDAFKPEYLGPQQILNGIGFIFVSLILLLAKIFS
jgi:hypothetical protein